MTKPRVSVVICTYNRADSLERTLRSLQYLAYQDFEVIVVAGPCTDHTSEVLADPRFDIKVLRNDQPNLSVSRNLGIAAAGGDVVAFIDDDAVPDQTWLDDLIGAFDDPEVAATGGPVFDHTGYRLQARYSLADRWGDAHIETEPRSLDYLDHPDTWTFPYTIGTNALFRKELVIAVGGFDENYAFYLDETDLCLRLIERGYVVMPQDRGVVYHKFLSSGIRNAKRVTVDRFNVVMSRLYFSLRHGLPHSNEIDMSVSFAHFVESHRADYAHHIAEGNLPAHALNQFNEDLVSAAELAREKAAQPPLTKSREWFETGNSGFTPFPTIAPPGRRLRVCLATAGYPPEVTHGIARLYHTEAVGLAAAGHTVHVITNGRGHSTVDFEDGVWVHRIVPQGGGIPPIRDLPQHIWDRSVTVRDEIRRIDEFASVDVVQTPNWDAEGLAVMLDDQFRTVLGAHTPVLAVAEHDARVDPGDPVVMALAAAERVGYERADLVMVAFPSTIEELQRLYGVVVPGARTAVMTHGVPDLEAPKTEKRQGEVEVLFVGRLEGRKGIDTLLAAIPLVCLRHPGVTFTLVGEDSASGPDGRTWQRRFEEEAPADVVERVWFAGPLGDDETVAAFARCDVFVAPSRFESFGLVNVEAMRFAKPVVSTNVNGVASVVRDNWDGVLVEPGNPDALAGALCLLLEQPDQRSRMGQHAREAFEQRFTVDRMVQSAVSAFEALIDGKSQVFAEQLQPTEVPVATMTEVASRRQQNLIAAVRCPVCRADLDLLVEVITRDGRVKDGSLWCSKCNQMAAEITTFQLSFVEVTTGERSRSPVTPRIVGEIGEQRLVAPTPLVHAPGWSERDGVWSTNQSGGVLRFRGVCTDIRLRILNHPAGARVKVSVDDHSVLYVESKAEEGSVSRTVDVASNLDLAAHELIVEIDEIVPDEWFALQEIIILGPRGNGLPFVPFAPFSRANPYSERILTHLSRCDASGLILECGGGDRRTDRPNHLNMEFLPYEGADFRADLHLLPFEDNTFDIILNQAVLEHVADPRRAVSEMIRVCKPGGRILTEVAFMQPLHAVPYHFYNMTQWGTEELFRERCSIEESDWFGPLSFTMEWLIDAAGITSKMPPIERAEWSDRLKQLDDLVDHDALRAVASGIWVVARKER